MMYPYPAMDNLGMYRQSYMPMPNSQIPVQSQDERIWVTGRVGADAYLVAPNGFVRLWDNTSPLYYEKRADATGRPSIATFEYKPFESPPQPLPADKCINTYAEELEALKGRISALEKKYEQNDSAVQ